MQYDVTIELIEPMLGTVPKNPEIYSTYIEAKKPANIEETESDTVPFDPDKGYTGFHRDEEGNFIYKNSARMPPILIGG